MIEVESLGSNTYRVKVSSRTPTEHQVTIDPEYHRELVGADVSADELLRHSFQFLLEREPNTSILRQFDLQVIERYFPEYRREISKRS